jgi:hypothetical protein
LVVVEGERKMKEKSQALTFPAFMYDVTQRSTAPQPTDTEKRKRKMPSFLLSQIGKYENGRWHVPPFRFLPSFSRLEKTWNHDHNMFHMTVVIAVFSKTALKEERPWTDVD